MEVQQWWSIHWGTEKRPTSDLLLSIAFPLQDAFKFFLRFPCATGSDAQYIGNSFNGPCVVYRMATEETERGCNLRKEHALSAAFFTLATVASFLHSTMWEGVAWTNQFHTRHPHGVFYYGCVFITTGRQILMTKVISAWFGGPLMFAERQLSMTEADG